MNETIKTLLNRSSCKSYLDKAVPDELINEVVETGLYAPNGMGMQNTACFVITNKEIRDELEKENANVMGKEGIHPFYNAPVVILVIAKGVTGIYDGSCTMDNMLNAAYSLGLGACWIHRAKETCESEFGKKLLLDNGFNPAEWIGIGNLILGYPAAEYKPKAPRKENRVIYKKEEERQEEERLKKLKHEYFEKFHELVPIIYGRDISADMIEHAIMTGMPITSADFGPVPPHIFL